MSPVRTLCVCAFLASAVLSGSAAAHGVRFGFNFGFPIYAPWYYAPPAYYYPPPVVVAPSPPVYVERRDAQPAPPQEHWWYYCAESQSYYPYVKDCPSPWQRVSPRPPTL